MNILFSFKPVAWQRLHTGPLSPYINRFAQHLLQQGYADATARIKLRVVAKLSRWLEYQQLGLDSLDEKRVADFLKETHRRWRRAHMGDATTLQDLLEQLHTVGAITRPDTTCEESPLRQIEDDFALHLSEERGLARTTIDSYVPIVRHFLIERFDNDQLMLDQLCSQDVTRFVLGHLCHLSPKYAQLKISALRGFFKFLYQQGKLRTDLAAALPTAANWRRDEVPKFIAPEEVERLLDSCDQHHPVGQRDYAVLLLLARMGLRAGEVVHLTLDNIDWHTGLLNVRGKGKRMDQLPLPVDVGEALATYLRSARPHCATRRVFVRMLAPHSDLAGSSSIGAILCRALQRAGLEPPRKGAHLLRHTLATGMLRDGVSLIEIGQLLRHRHSQTTEIYAKVDASALAAVVQPWPGEIS